jgi:hypothetical protein
MRRTSLPLPLLVLLASLVASAGRADPNPPPKFLCALAGDELRLRIDKPHGRELAILAPSGVLYLLAFGSKPGLPDEPHPPFDRFKSAHELSLDAHSLEGWRHQAGKQRWEPVFGARGSYVLRVGDDVTNAAAPDLSYCTVTRK